jgi:hypothetical protein
MKTLPNFSALPSRYRATLMTVAVALGAPQLASAVDVHTYVSSIHQWGTGSGFYLGHTVTASTIFNGLSAGGAYTAQCNHPATLPLTGERSFAGSTLIGPTRLVVTIPAQQPAIRNLSGWLQVPPETLLSCGYRWTSYATESGISISAGGVGVQYGNGSAREGGTTDFTMYRRARPEDAGGGCAP